MNRILLQLWEESDRILGLAQDGCSLHIDDAERSIYIDSVYRDRTGSVPNEYDKIIGDPIYVFIEDNLFILLKDEKSIRIPQYQLNNLIEMGDLTYKL